MKVSDFSISPTTIAPGDDVSIRLTVKAEKGDTIKQGIYVWMSIPDYGEVAVLQDESTKLTAGKSKTIAMITKIDFGDYVPERGKVATGFGVQLGLYGTRKDISRSVTLLDARYTPDIKVFDAERSVGSEPDDEGENLITEIRLSAGAKAKTDRLSLKLRYKDAQDDAAAWKTVNLSSSLKNQALSSTVFTAIAETLQKNTDWAVELIFGDGYESNTKSITVPKSFANVHLSGAANGGVCFGAYSQSTDENPLFQCYYPAEFEGGIRGVTNYHLNEPGSVADNVSGIEVDTGGKLYLPGKKWNEGENIYRYVWRGNVSTYNAQYKVTSLPRNPDIVLSLRGMLKRSDGAWLPIPYIYRTDLGYAANLRTDGRQILLGLGDKYVDAEELIVICEYTEKSGG